MKKYHRRHRFMVQAMETKEGDSDRKKVWHDPRAEDLDVVQCVRVITSSVIQFSRYGWNERFCRDWFVLSQGESRNKFEVANIREREMFLAMKARLWNFAGTGKFVTLSLLRLSVCGSRLEVTIFQYLLMMSTITRTTEGCLCLFWGVKSEKGFGFEFFEVSNRSENMLQIKHATRKWALFNFSITFDVSSWQFASVCWVKFAESWIEKT